MFLLLLSLARAEDPCGGVGALPREGAVIATVDGVPVTESMVQATLAQLPAETQEALKAQGMGRLNDQVILAEQLYAEACRNRVLDRPEVKTAVAVASRNAIANALLSDIVKQRTTPERINTWYQDHLVQFARPQARARHILVEKEADAKALLARLQKGEDFATLAANSLDTASAVQGGELGWFSKNEMVAPFADAVFSAPVGKVVGPVKTEYGYHLIEVEERRDQIPLSEVKDKIEEQLRDEIVSDYLDEIKEKHPAQ